jgi:hypothetical protein
MLISHRKKFIYFKTIKTAGTSVEIFFEPYCLPENSRHGEAHAITETVSNAGIVGSRMELWKKEHRFYSHMRAAEVKEAVGEAIFNSYFKFCIIRNPFDKAVSFFWWTQFKKPTAWDHLNKAPFSAVKTAFCTFMETAHLPADRDIYPINGAPVVDAFIRFENLTGDLREICSRIGIGRPAREIGTYKSGMRLRPEPYRDYFDARAEAAVRTAYAWELENLGYEF